MDRPLFALCALLLNIALAGPRHWYEALGALTFLQAPAVLLRKTERKLNRESRSIEERKWRGDLLTIIILAASLLTGWIVGILSKHGFEFLELLLLTVALPVRPTWDRMSQIRRGLQAGNNAAAHKALDGTVWRHHAVLDNYGLARAAVELLAVNFTDKIIAPLLWYLLLGLPGLFASKAIALLQETLMPPGGKRFAPGFGQAAQITHHWMNFIPARLAALFWLAVAAFLPSCQWKKTAKEITTGMAGETPQIVALLSVASVFNLSLGGPVSVYANERWIGTGTPKPTPADIKRAQHLFALLVLLLFILLGIFL